MMGLLICFAIQNLVTELFIRGRKLTTSLDFIIQCYFAVPKNIKLNSAHYFTIKIPNKQKLQQTAFNYLSDINFKGPLSGLR